MKKLITVILAVLYLATSNGMNVQLHYCMGKLSDWGLGHHKSKTCGECGMEKSEEKDNGCCKEENKFVKNETDQKIAESGLQMMQFTTTALPVFFYEIPDNTISSGAGENPISHAPPRCCKVAVYLLNRTFRI